jgi:hypothetical protein
LKRTIVAACAATLALACQESPQSTSATSPPAFDVSEARFGGGNPDFFFGTPLAANPKPGDTNFDVGQSNGALVPYVRICETDGAHVVHGTPTEPHGCTLDVTDSMTGSPTGLAMTYGSGNELYQVNWQTKGLDVHKDYRVEVWGLPLRSRGDTATVDPRCDPTVQNDNGGLWCPRWLFGWRDIRNSPNTANCTGSEPYCYVNYGQTIPIKVRIEQYVFCPVDKNCAVQFVKANTDANLVAELPHGSGASSAELYIPGQSNTDFALAFYPCSETESEAVDNALDLPTYGPCLKTNSNFADTLGTPAIVSLCSHVDTTGWHLSPDQLDQLAIHHVSENLHDVQALAEAYPMCGATPTAGGSASARVGPSPLRQFARRLRDRVAGWMEPRSLMAVPLPLHTGGGGQTVFLQSFFKLALPAKMRYVIATDSAQVRPVSSLVPLEVEVTDLYDVPVKNARVHWMLVSPPGLGATVAPTTYLTGADGIAHTTVTLSSVEGNNLFRAYGRGIADSSYTPCTLDGMHMTAPCDGPRSAFDPFIPYPAEGEGMPSTVGVPVPDSTRLPFRVYGCAPGTGSATVDGAFGQGEWDCADTASFTANVSGGSTPAKLYWMTSHNASGVDTLYLAVRVRRSSTDKVNTLQFNFDNDASCPNMLPCSSSSGAAATNDDVLSVTLVADTTKEFTDAYLTAKCTNSSQSSCWATDVSAGGASNGRGRVLNDGTYTTYEIAHPLNSGDVHDFALSAGNKVGLFLTLQTGNGAQGNTQWPGFRQYREITIQ